MERAYFGCGSHMHNHSPASINNRLDDMADDIHDNPQGNRGNRMSLCSLLTAEEFLLTGSFSQTRGGGRGVGVTMCVTMVIM